MHWSKLDKDLHSFEGIRHTKPIEYTKFESGSLGLNKDLCVVGLLEPVKKALSKLAAENSDLSILEQLKDDLKAGYGGSKTVTTVSFNNKLKKITIVTFPDTANRHLPKCRPDLVPKNLMGGLDDTLIICAIDCPKCVLPLAQAVARSMPKYSLKQKEDDNVAPSSHVVFFSENDAHTNSIDYTKLNKMAECTQMVAALVEAPPNKLNCATYKNYVKNIIKNIDNVTMETVEYDDLLKKGYGGLEAVGRAAEEKSCLVVLKHTPPGSDGKKKGIALVGKGIVFDTGGLALKPRDGMCGMKHDMGGSAGVFGAFCSIAQLGGLQDGAPLYCLMCMAENAVDMVAFRQDDVLTMYSGLTCEINNTDAEGRLVLADGVAHVAKHLHNEVDLTITMATLTGAQGIAGGSHFGCLVCSDEEVETKMKAAGMKSGDTCTAMPFAPEVLLSEFDSNCADMKNSVKNRANCQVSCAGLFIWKHFTHANKDYKGKFCHIDMAYPATTEKDRGSGYGVGLLSAFTGVI